MQIDNTLGRRGYAGNFEKTVVQACLPHSYRMNQTGRRKLDRQYHNLR